MPPLLYGRRPRPMAPPAGPATELGGTVAVLIGRDGFARPLPDWSGPVPDQVTARAVATVVPVSPERVTDVPTEVRVVIVTADGTETELASDSTHARGLARAAEQLRVGSDQGAAALTR